jgi:hypothetical protein
MSQFLKSKIGVPLYEHLIMSKNELDMRTILEKEGYSDLKASEIIKILIYVKKSQ